MTGSCLTFTVHTIRQPKARIEQDSASEKNDQLRLSTMGNLFAQLTTEHNLW